MPEPGITELAQNTEFSSKYLKVESVSKEFNVVFVHSIRPDILYGQNNSTFANKSWDEKLDHLLSTSPEIATSTVRIGDTSDNMWGPMGVILSGGDILAASPKDAGSIVSTNGERDTASSKDALKIAQDVNTAILLRPERRYNEIIVNNPHVEGLYMAFDPIARASIHNRNYAGLAPRISDQEMYRASLKYKLPLFLIDEGKFFKAGFDENNQELIKLDEVSYNNI